MKRPIHCLGAALALLALASAPASASMREDPPKKQTPAAKEKPKSALETKLEDALARLTKAREEFTKKLEAAEDKAARNKLLRDEMPEKVFLPELQAIAEEAKGTETGAKALVQVAMIAGQAGDEEAGKTAVRTLVEKHAESPEIAVVLFMADFVLGEEEGAKARETIAAKNKTKPVQAAQLYIEIQTLEQTDEDSSELRPKYEKLGREYGDLKLPWRDQTYSSIAEAWLFVKDNLVVGKVAPDMETTDENGVKWKLSDYRGKVVILDFWGMW
jgi:hypothetical protein